MMEVVRLLYRKPDGGPLGGNSVYRVPRLKTSFVYFSKKNGQADCSHFKRHTSLPPVLNSLYVLKFLS